MPASIALSVREALSAALVQVFAYADELDAWLHAQHPALDGASPFERLIEGDGVDVLRVLLEGNQEEAGAARAASLLGEGPMKPGLNAAMSLAVHDRAPE